VEYVIAPSLSQLLGKSVASVASGYDKLMLLIPLLIVPICVVGAGLGYWFVDVLAGDEYTSEAYLTSGAFCIVGLLKTLTTIRVATVFVVCPSTSRLKITLGQFVVYFGLLYLLVSHIGILGAAIAQGCSFIFGFLYAARMLSPILGKRKISRLVRIVFLTSVIGLLAIIGLQLWYYSIFVVPVYVLAVAGIVILAISLLAKDSDLQELEGILPNQLKNVFGIYFRARNRLFGKS
jgi:O-antigen/teichoic acid export membrane protein